MIINKLDLLSKGWKTSEIEKASQILEAAEDKKGQKVKFLDGLLIAILVALMLANGVVSSTLLAPFIYAMPASFVLIIAAVVGFIFSALFTLVIYDIEKIHHKHETKLFVAYIVNGVMNFYFVLEFAARFGERTKLPLMINIYLVAGIYFIAFLIPQVVYQLRKRKEN